MFQSVESAGRCLSDNTVIIDGDKYFRLIRFVALPFCSEPFTSSPCRQLYDTINTATSHYIAAITRQKRTCLLAALLPLPHQNGYTETHSTFTACSK
jgi:hypothetical protein